MSKEIDNLIANQIMGWTFCQSSFEQYEPSQWSKDGKFVWGREFSPSTDIRAAWAVVEKIGPIWRGFKFEICWSEPYEKKWRIGWTEDDYGGSEMRAGGYYDSVPLGICEAALEILKIEVRAQLVVM